MAKGHHLEGWWALTAEVWRETGNRCWYCGISGEGITRAADHVTPVYYGGRDTRDNLVATCLPCNGRKSHRSIEAFRRSMAMRAAGWPKFKAHQLDWLEAQGLKLPHFTFYGETIGLTLPKQGRIGFHD